MSGELGKLKMTRCKVHADGTLPLDSTQVFVALVNPADFKRTAGISYEEQPKLGQPKANTKFSSVNKEHIDFSLVLDGTGAVPGPVASVKDLLEQLQRVVYQYDGESHEPPYVQLVWGTLMCYVRLESMTTHHTLFKPSGEPLRAKVDLTFVTVTTDKAMKLIANLSSPDLSHRVFVREGDTLPLLCDRIYGDPGYYLEVARINGLPDFRRLEPGRQLHFPPLE